MGSKNNPIELFRIATIMLIDTFGTSQVELAGHLKIKPGKLNDYLKNRCNFSEKVRMKIADFFKLSYIEMLNYESAEAENAWFFIWALTYFGKKDWFNRTNQLAHAAGIKKSEFNKIYNRKIQPSYKIQMALAKACGVEYKTFIDVGKREYEKIKKKMYPGEEETPPTSTDPGVELLNEVLAERNQTLSQKQAIRLAQAAKIILEDDEETEKLIKSAADRETAKDFYSLISDLEILSTKDYYKYYGEIKGLVISLKRREKTSNDPNK